MTLITWLLVFPGNNILPVYSSYIVQPADHMSIPKSHWIPKTKI